MSFASKLRKVLVAAISGALALSTISAMPASAAGPVYASGDAVSSSYVGTNATLSQNGEVTIPENVTNLSADVNFSLGGDFFTENLGKTIGISRKVTGPDNIVIVSGSDYSIYGTPYMNFCEAGYTNCKDNTSAQPPVSTQVVLANQAEGNVSVYTNIYRMSGMNDLGPRKLAAGTYKIEIDLTVDGVVVAADGTDVILGTRYVRYSVEATSNFTVPTDMSSINMNTEACVDSAKIAVGDVVTPTFYVNDVAQNVGQWDLDYNTRAREQSPSPRQEDVGASQSTATITQNDIDYGLAVRMFKGVYNNLTAGATYTWGMTILDQDGNDVTGSCAPGAAGKPSLAYDSMMNRITATITSPAKFADEIRCEFFKSTDLSTVVGSGYAWSNMPNSPATCTLNNGVAGNSYVVKVRGLYYEVLGEYSPASDAVSIPLPGISVSPAVSGVTDVAGKVSVVSSDVAHFTTSNGNRISADGVGGAYRAYTFSTSGSCPPNCGPPTYSYKLRQSNASGYVAGFAGTGTVEFAPTGQGGGNLLLGWYGAAGDKWTLGSTTTDMATNTGQIEVIQGTNASATTTSIKVNKAEAQATCDELGAGYTTASMPNSNSINAFPVNAPTAKQLLVLYCYKTVTMSDNITPANLPNPVLVTVDGNNALTLVKALGEHSASVNSSQVSFSVNPAPAAGGVMLTALVTKKNVTAYMNFSESAGTVTAREIVRFKADLTSTVTTNGWISAGTSISNEPAMVQPAVNNGDYFVMQRTNGMPSATFKIAKVTSSGAVGALVDVTIDKAADLVGANLSFPIGAQSASASAVQVLANAPGMGMGAATSISVVSVNTSTGAAKAGEIVKYTTSGQSFALINNFMVDPSTSDVHWWFADAAAGVDKLSIYKWRDHLYVKPSGPVPAVTSKNLEYATNTPAAGTKVTFTGTNLNLATAVKFGTVAATLGTKTATSLEVTVPAGTGTVAITIESANGNGAGGNFTYVGANKVAQTVTLDAGASTAAKGDADRTLSATVAITGYTAVASLTYSSTTAAVCTVTGNKLKFVAKGTCTVKATQAGSSWTAEGVATKDITVTGPDDQTITVKAPSAGEKLIGPDGFFIYPSTNSGLPLSIRFDTPSVCKKGTFAANHVVNVKTGTCTITVLGAGNLQWAAGTTALTYTVGKAGTTSITDAGNAGAPVVLKNNGTKTNVLSEVVSWKKSTGALTISSRGVWVGPITATATFKVGSKSYTCSLKYGTLKAASATSVKGFPATTALCGGKTSGDKAALAALKKIAGLVTVKIVVVRELRNPTKYTTKGQKITRAVYVTVG